MAKKIIILGAGLSGLLTAYHLQNKGFEIEIVEARNRVGGRIHTIKDTNTQIEMGATWFNEAHTNFRKLLSDFNLDYYEQFMTGTSFFEPFSAAPPQDIDIPQNSPSYRVTGGTSHLIDSILNKLIGITIHLNEAVTNINFENNTIKVTTTNTVLEADYVISTLPQALFTHDIKVAPSLPIELQDLAKKTHTWMQDAIKVAFVYDTAFWRNKNISGTLFSNVGPITEFYDQSNEALTTFALCGFISSGMEMYTKEERLIKLKTQLEKVFGQEALQFTSYHETVWSKEEFTKSAKQIGFMYPHQNNGHPLFRKNYCDNRLLFAGTETAQQHPGYMEGAVVAAQRVANEILKLENKL
ncbi:NAD(P)/FAD-dependent oxidoreductase [Flavobacterium frigidarium]|uniref:flavin monoamine oxidase family protein n=1 Tax=Flavobacterium frigidarium TaxID=99286 RepID=UPI0030D74570|tara:strand:- start:995 stop:2059 length:1065 start_codon:yes stop_codon:yes gene_type:complete